MRPISVESATLATVGYDLERAVLRLQFRDGLIYEYFGVPAAVHDALLISPSKGGYFNRVIRGRFAYARASEQEDFFSLS
jgi:KTSC domain-containing protein